MQNLADAPLVETNSRLGPVLGGDHPGRRHRSAGWMIDLRDGFDTNARIMHRLLSQRVQHDATLATLALLQPGPDIDLPTPSAAPARAVPGNSRQRRDRGRLGRPVSDLLEAASRTQKRAVLGTVDFAAGRYQLLLAALPASSYALTIDLRAMVPWAEWPPPPADQPGARDAGAGGPELRAAAGSAAPDAGWRFELHQAPGRRQPAVRRAC
ncbi:MAG: hypothetical protein MZW92_59630 [Comamonadaceae bacterium]|nr:hypothetical protein [Comamonadaceae bacterium]